MISPATRPTSVSTTITPSDTEMKVFESSYVFEYPWANVSIANWRKYGTWNTQSTHVVAVDTLNRSVDPSTGIVSIPRLATPHPQLTHRH